MSQKLYDSAIEQYTEAIKLDSNPVYYSNRAAAWGGLGEHAKAVEDAEKAIELDPKFSKAYSRLGYVVTFLFSPISTPILVIEGTLLML
jgi:small glutamine-rich tetratricopeptide repeat-containing protein alpha